MEPTEGSRQRLKRRVEERERKRAIKACDGCRRLKEKCDGGVPCHRCVRLRRPCEFIGPPPKTRTAPDSSSRAKSPDQNHAELAQRADYLERLLRHYAGDINLDPENLRNLVEDVDNKDNGNKSDNLSESDSEYLAADEDGFIVTPVGNNTTHYSGEFSHFIFSMRIKEWIEQSMPRSENAEARGYKEFYRVQSLQSSSAKTALAALPPRFVAEFLVESFFRHAETNYFYVERQWLQRRLDMAYNNPGSFTQVDVGTVCIIFVVLAVGTQFAYLDSAPNRGRRDNGDDDDGLKAPFSEDSVGIMFYQQACKMLPDVITVSTLESVQACLLIGLYTLPLDASGLSYNYLNLAIKLGIQNGMHRKYVGDGLDPFTRETRSRIWWTAYTTERRVAIFHGRPVSVPVSEIDADIPSDAPDIWPCSSPTHVQAMLASMEIHRMLSKISQEISLLKMHAKKKGAFDTLSRLVNLKNELHTWWQSLPYSLGRKTSVLEQLSIPITRSEAHLRLEYCLTRMFAGRSFMFLRGTPNSSTSPVESAQRQQRASNSPRKTDSRAILISDCVDAAIEVIDTCKLVRDHIGLARASYTEFSSIRSALLVIIARSLQGNTDKLRDSLRDGIAMIKILSVGGESARAEATLIEMLERAIARLGTPDLTPTPTSVQESDYARFKRWEMLWKSEPAGDLQSTGGNPDVPPMQDMPELMPPPTTGPWGGLAGMRRLGGMPSQDTQPVATGMDWDFASFPQNMDEFSMMFGQGLGQSPNGGFDLGSDENLWMGS